jgi:hypothetical protein
MSGNMGHPEIVKSGATGFREYVLRSSVTAGTFYGHWPVKCVVQRPVQYRCLCESAALVLALIGAL